MSPSSASRIRVLARLLAASAALTLVLTPVAPASTPAIPIQSTGPVPTLPAFIGVAATNRPVLGVGEPWQNPFLATDPRNSVHNDAWQSDNYTRLSGPLGRHLRTLSTGLGRDCITLTFDTKGRLIGTCTDLTHGPGLYLLDPQTLAMLAFRQLPYVPPPAGTNPALNTTGGAYFFLDRHNHIVLAASNRQILVFGIDDAHGAPQFKQLAAYDPTPCLSAGDRMPSVLPDAQGRLWFVGRYHGAVGVLDTKTGHCRSVILREEIENSFAVGSDGVYIVTDKAMYKFRAGASLAPRRIWSMRYRNSGIHKPGQINAGSGTTPTLIGPLSSHSHSTVPAYVAITDNADPMNVVVYRSQDRLRAGQRRVVCQVPVFSKGASADENSLISMGRSLIVENNYGYDLQKWNDVIGGGVHIGGNLGLLSSPGMDRIDIAPNGSGCRIVWRNTTVRTPSAVAKGDTANGLIYTYQKVRDPGQPGAGVWYWTALDYRTGKVVWKHVAGHGGLYNNHYAGIALGRNPRTGKTTLYLGGVGGIAALRDG
jgi:hypothetical protein